MIAVSSAYQTVHDNLNRTPVYRVTFARSGRTYSTHKICDYKSEVLADEADLYLRLGEASGMAAEDESGNNLDGVYQNAPTLGVTGALSGCSNKAVTFNGSNEYITVADNALLDPGDTFSIEFWVNPPAPDVVDRFTFISKGTDGYLVEYGAATDATWGGVILVKQGGADIVCSTTALTESQWNHVVITKSGATVKIYINGVDRTGTVTNQTIAGTATALNIARSSAGTGYIAASFDEVALYPTALSATRVLAHYDAGKLLQYLTTWLPYMQLPTSIASQIDPRAGRSSIGAMTIFLNDLDDEITDLVSLGIGNDTVTFEAGFAEIQGEEFEPFMTAIVESVKLASDLVAYEVALRDPQSLVNKDFAECAATKLSANLARDAADTYFHHVEILGLVYHLTNTQDAATFEATLDGIYGAANWSFLSATTAVVGSTITVTDTTFFLSSGYVMVDKEIIAYTGKTATTFTGLTRGALSSTAAAHNSDAPCRELLRIGPAHPCDIITSVYTRSDKRGLDIGADYEGEVMADGADLYLRLGEGSGTTATDSSGNALHGTYQNTPTLGVDGALQSDSNGAVTLNGSDEYVTVADNALLDPGDTFTLEAWVYYTTTPAVAQVIIDKGVNGYQLYIKSTDQLVLDKDNASEIVVSTITVSKNVWSHVVATKSGSTVKLYINGVDVSGTVTNLTIVGTATALNIGRQHTSNYYFNGSLDEVAIYPTALSAARVLAHYNAGISTERIDGTTFKSVKQSIGTQYEMEFRITSRVNAKKFLEDEIFRILACYPITTGDGKLSIREFAEPEAADSVEEIDEDSILVDSVGKPVMSWDGNLASRINHVVYEYDHDPTEVNDTLKYKTTREDEDDLSIDTYGRTSLVFSSQGLRSSLNATSTLIDARMDLILQRYTSGAPLVTVRTHMQKNLIEPGDIISLTSTILPNRFAHARGITDSLFEVVKRSIAFDRGYVDFELLWTGFSLLGHDDFNRADTDWDSEPDLNKPEQWDSNSACLEGIEVNSNRLRMGNFGAGSGGHGFLHTAAGDNQISELEFVSETDGISGPAVRQSPIGGYLSYTGYVAFYDPVNTVIKLRKYVAQDMTASTGTELGTYTVTLVATDVIRLHVNGSTLNVYLNGTLIIGPVTDTAITGGSSGAAMSKATGGIIWDNWRGGDDGWA